MGQGVKISDEVKANVIHLLGSIPQKNIALKLGISESLVHRIKMRLDEKEIVIKKTYESRMFNVFEFENWIV